MSKTRRITISDIKYDTLAAAPHFFDRATLKFFGQTMRDYHIRKSPKGKIFIFAKGNHNLMTFREYVPGKRMGHGRLRHVSRPEGMTVREYIERH